MPNKHALIIGVDHYPNLDPQYQLSGCVNDARLIRQVLTQRFGFAEEAITSLHNEAATRTAIMAAMERLLSEIAADDVVFFHFSGHGSRRTSASPEEASGKDSTLMPSDSGRHPLPNLDIVDDEIHEWLGQLSAKTRAISLLIDCCHSGTITRDPFAAKVRAAPDDTRSLVEMGIDTPRVPVRNRPRAAGETAWQSLGDAYVVMSGCRDNEYAHEFTDQRGGETIRNGALTHYLASALLEATPGSTYRDVFERAQLRVNGQFASQHPQIEGARDRELFGDRDIVPIRFVPVASVSGDEITLAGGAAHGLRPGARWSVYPPATRSTDGVTPLARIEIVRVDGLSAVARAESGAAAIPVGARCVETEPTTEHLRLALDLGTLSSAMQHTLREAIAAAPLLCEAGSADAADLRIYRLEARDRSTRELAAAGEPAPELGPLAQTSWVVIDRSGQLAMPPRACDAEGAIAGLIDNAQILARYANALALENPDSRLAIDFQLYREDSEGQWVKLASSGEALRVGDAVAFEVVNREARPVFISVLDFGVSGTVSLLYPPNKSSELLEAGQTLRIGSGKRRIRLGLPEGFSADVGQEAFKLFVTLDETDFSWLQQSGTRSLGAGAGRLRRLFAAAYSGPVTRDASLSADPDEDGQDWCALARRFELHRH